MLPQLLVANCKPLAGQLRRFPVSQTRGLAVDGERGNKEPLWSSGHLIDVICGWLIGAVAQIR